MDYQLLNNFWQGQLVIKSSISNVEQILTDKFKKNLRLVTAYLDQQQHLFIIGRGNLLPIALETALKIKEVSYLHSEGFASGELKHGVLAKSVTLK